MTKDPAEPPREGPRPDPKHLSILREGVEAWNEWRKRNPKLVPGLNGTDLRRGSFREANLSRTDLSGANLSEADLRQANLREANLSGADLSKADLRRANLCEADLSGADLSQADLVGANLTGARLDLHEAKSMGAKFGIVPELSLPRPASAEEASVETLPRTAAEPGPDLGTLPRASNVLRDDDT